MKAIHRAFVRTRAGLHPGAFPGAEKFYPERSKAKDRWGSGQVGMGDYESPDQWLARLKPDAIVAFFGSNESFQGSARLNSFKAELEGFIRHTTSQKYNGSSVPRLALVSPIAFEDLSETHGTPAGTVTNANLALYAAAMEDVAAVHDVLFVNAYAASQKWYDQTDYPLTIDGFQLTDEGYQRLARLLADTLIASPHPNTTSSDNRAQAVRAAVREKNWLWHKHYKIPNGVHVYGRRHRPFGPVNYPHELKKPRRDDRHSGHRDLGGTGGQSSRRCEAGRMDAPLAGG